MFEKVHKLYNDVITICQNHRCDEWKNSWMWDSSQDNLLYYYLIYFDAYSDSCKFEYQDIDDVYISIKYDNWNKKYRIDLKDRYGLHNFWYFDNDKFIFVEKYIKEIIECQYESLEKHYFLMKLTNDSYAYDKEPLEMYNKMKLLFRKDKLEKINVESW